jgi:hypothetical protein
LTAIPAMQITPDDILRGKPLKIVEEEEAGWTKLKVEDGTTLWIKLIVTSIVKLEKYNPDGTPIYSIQSQNLMRQFVPDDLRRKPPDIKEAAKKLTT